MFARLRHDRWSRILPLLPNCPGYDGQCLYPGGVISAQQQADTGADDCAHRNITMNNDDGGCGGTYESWSMHTFVDPRPPQADYEVPGTRQTQQQPPCPPPPPPSGGGGGGDDDNGGGGGNRPSGPSFSAGPGGYSPPKTGGNGYEGPGGDFGR